MTKSVELQFDTEIRAASDPNSISQAKNLLGKGQLVAIPTETVYGLAANAFSEEAVARIFDVKGRPANNPLIVHVSSVEMAQDCVSAWPDEADILAENFWPGPLSMILPKSEKISNIVTAGGLTVAVRCPSHSIMKDILGQCGFPLAAPSANLSNRVSPTKAEYVADQLSGRIPLILDGGACQIGIESTVIDLTGQTPTILRLGLISQDHLQEVLGDVRVAAFENEANEMLKSPGQLQSHYSPRAKVIIGEGSWEDLLNKLNKNTHVIACESVPNNWSPDTWHEMPKTVQGYAKKIYETLNRCDQANAESILIQPLPLESEWDAVRDRLSRASIN